MPATPSSWRSTTASLLAVALIAGCAITTVPLTPDAGEDLLTVSEAKAPEFIPVVRQGRYTLVELAPMAAQHNLLLQVVEVSMPEDARATVGDGLRHVLKRSGYRLCETAPAAAELYALPLPAAHLHLGPMTLREALITLTGPAWELHADDRAREVCFDRPVDNTQTASVPEQPAVNAVQTFPVTGGQQ